MKVLKLIQESKGKILAIAHLSADGHKEPIFFILERNPTGIGQFDLYQVESGFCQFRASSMLMETAMGSSFDYITKQIEWTIIEDKRLTLSPRKKPITHKGVSIE